MTHKNQPKVIEHAYCAIPLALIFICLVGGATADSLLDISGTPGIQEGNATGLLIPQATESPGTPRQLEEMGLGAALPDLYPNLDPSNNHVYLPITPNPVKAGDDAFCEFYIGNSGDTAAGPFNVVIVISKDTTITMSDDQLRGFYVPGLEGKGNRYYGLDLTFPPGITSGTYYSGILIDWTGDVTESNENNNIDYDAHPIVVNNPKSRIGVYRDGTWYLYTSGNGAYGGGDAKFAFGAPGWIPVVGDWDGNGYTEIGVYRDGRWYLDKTGDGVLNVGDANYPFGALGWTPIVGDWNGDHKTEVGVYHDGIWYLDLSGNGLFGAGDARYAFGAPGWNPVVGDWDADRATEIAVYRDGSWYLDRYGDGTFGQDDVACLLGAPGCTPVTLAPDGFNSYFGVYKDGLWYLSDPGHDTFSIDKIFAFGATGYTPLKGDWDRDGIPEIAVSNGATWYLDVNGDDSFSTGDARYAFGAPGWTPVVGAWNDSIL